MDLQIGAVELNNPHSKLGSVQVTTVKILVAQFRQNIKAVLRKGAFIL